MQISRDFSTNAIVTFLYMSDLSKHTRPHSTPSAVHNCSHTSLLSAQNTPRHGNGGAVFPFGKTDICQCFPNRLYYIFFFSPTHIFLNYHCKKVKLLYSNKNNHLTECQSYIFQMTLFCKINFISRIFSPKLSMPFYVELRMYVQMPAEPGVPDFSGTRVIGGFELRNKSVLSKDGPLQGTMHSEPGSHLSRPETVFLNNYYPPFCI